MAHRIQYVIKRGITDGIDYNNDGTINEHDDIVVKYVNGKEVGRRLLNPKTEKQLARVIMKNPKTQKEPTQRVVYKRMPSQQAAAPSPVIIKDESTFGHYVKAGAGLELGSSAVDGALGVLGDMFSS